MVPQFKCWIRFLPPSFLAPWYARRMLATLRKAVRAAGHATVAAEILVGSETLRPGRRSRVRPPTRLELVLSPDAEDARRRGIFRLWNVVYLARALLPGYGK